MTIFSRFCANEAGVTAVEYAIILAAVFVAIVLSLGSVGQATLELIGRVVDAFPTL